ncbi:hypothetical protein HIV01_004250 [Lysobacter arenosi]|uniref:DUF5681 domain-containing protein n=1 Tax=Lysobacter arenosi TaxID=2795387 RepID=A0ABX7RC59_9GAMM|nr:DUF5681 domain-containing protein [Lysobacter arenosi]QSX75743.1 hypothetical protein HIV01_004250 [Lysobacter arenosi]
MARFKKGAPSPNPRGRPKGSKSAPNLLRQDLISEDDVKEVIAKVVTMAKGGDLAAAAIVLDRTVPKLKPRVADVEDESNLAEALQAARVRAIQGAGGGVSLETLVVMSGVPPRTNDAIASSAVASLPAKPPAAATSASPSPSNTTPVRPVRLSLPATDDPINVYNPLEGGPHDY